MNVVNINDQNRNDMAPLPSGFDNKVRIVTNTPVVAADINAELTAQFALNYWCFNIIFTDADNAFMIFGRFNDLVEGAPQKVNLVAQTQAAIDADKTTQLIDGYYPTGLFATPDGDLLILYSQVALGSGE